jgi:hypothetical protein
MKVNKEVVRQIGKSLVAMSKLIDDDSRHLIARLLDVYWQMPPSHQKNLLHHILDSTPIDRKWAERVEDETEWGNLFRELLWQYSGRSEIGQPSKKQFKVILLKYVNSKWCDLALEDDGDTESFQEMLKEI